jgi:hypothetical protein
MHDVLLATVAMLLLYENFTAAQHHPARFNGRREGKGGGSKSLVLSI